MTEFYGISLCQNGTMSQCEGAGDPIRQRMCNFWDKATQANRCSNLNENLNNHCWSPKAQAVGYHPPEEYAGLDLELDDESRDDLLDLVEMAEAQRVERSCVDCILFTCSHVIHENSMAQPRGGLTHDDLCNIARGCTEYDDEETMKAKINQSIRGILP